MKTIFFLVFVLFTPLLFAQQIGVERSEVYSYKITENSIIYDKNTNERMTFEDFNNLVKKFPNSEIKVKEEDVDGNPLSFFFIKNPNEESTEVADNKIVHIHRNDIYGKIFDIKNVESNNVLIILQLELEFPRINLNDIIEAESAAINKGLTSVILTSTDAKISKKFIEKNNINLIIIPNATFLMHEFGVQRFPAYLILDKNRSIISSLKYSYEVEDFLKKMN